MPDRREDAPQQHTYCAYLVRMWRDNPQSVWRASAQSAQSGQVVRFATLQALFAFLEAQPSATTSADDNINQRSNR